MIENYIDFKDGSHFRQTNVRQTTKMAAEKQPSSFSRSNMSNAHTNIRKASGLFKVENRLSAPRIYSTYSIGPPGHKERTANSIFNEHDIKNRNDDDDTRTDVNRKLCTGKTRGFA